MWLQYSQRKSQCNNNGSSDGVLFRSEHPLVKDTTNSDRALEGAFLGWDVSTPTAWIWSFRKKEAVRMHDPIFYLRGSLPLQGPRLR